MTIFRLKGADTQPAIKQLLHKLPVELRDQIYALALPPSPHHIIISAADAIHGTDSRYSYFLPLLCRINEATRIDIGLWFIRKIEFSILYPQNIVYFSQFLSTFPNNAGFGSVRRLDFQLFGRHRPMLGEGNAYVEFMKRCPRLSEVRVKFEVWHLLQRTPGKWLMPDSERMRLIENIPEAFGLEGLFEVSSLTSLTIEVWPRTVARTSQGVRVVVPNCWGEMERVAEWLRMGFEERGMEIGLRLVESGNAGLRWDGLGMGV